MQITRVDHQLYSVAGLIHGLFQRSYQIEADLIGVKDFPPLNRGVESLQKAESTFVGHYDGVQLASVVEYKSGPLLSIDSLLVDPEFFRKGLARQLLDHILNTVAWEKAVVETAVANGPAISLYLKTGFKEQRRWITDIGIEKIAFSMQAGDGFV